MVTCALANSDTMVSWLFKPLLTKVVKLKCQRSMRYFHCVPMRLGTHPCPEVTYLTVGSIQQSLGLQWDCKKKKHIFNSENY